MHYTVHVYTCTCTLQSMCLIKNRIVNIIIIHVLYMYIVVYSISFNSPICESLLMRAEGITKL